MCTEIQPNSKDFALNQNGWFLMILAKFDQKFLPNAKFGAVRSKELCVCFVAFFFIFPFFFFFFFFFTHIPHIAQFQFQTYIIFSFWEGTSPETPCVCKRAVGADAPIAHTPCVCKRAICSDTPPNHSPMSKTDVQPCVVLVYYLLYVWLTSYGTVFNCNDFFFFSFLVHNFPDILS